MPRGNTRCKECGQLTVYISWSKLRTHEECKQRAKLQSSGKRHALEDFRLFFPGTVTDRVVRDWLVDDPKSNPKGMPDLVKSVMQREEENIEEGRGSLRWKSLDDRDQVLQECIRAVEDILPALEEFVLPYEYIPDYRFKVPLDLPHPDGGYGQVILNGAIDILVKDDLGKYQVWDVKHTKNEDYWRKTSGQLTFYDIAIQLVFGSNTTMTGLFQPLCQEKVKFFEVSDDMRAQMNARIMSMASDIWAGDVAPREDNRYCNFCSVKHACPKFKPKVDGNGKRRMKLL